MALRQDDHGVTVEAAGRPFASYVVDESNKPYLWPVFGPTGKAMTRAYPMQDIPEEPAAKPVLVERRRLTLRADEATRWHVRTYGLFAANPFAQRGYDPALTDAATTLGSGETLRLHHRILLHSGDEAAGGVAAAWQAYARETPKPLSAAR